MSFSDEGARQPGKLVSLARHKNVRQVQAAVSPQVREVSLLFLSPSPGQRQDRDPLLSGGPQPEGRKPMAAFGDVNLAPAEALKVT